jgi:hypothetical protein
MSLTRKSAGRNEAARRATRIFRVAGDALDARDVSGLEPFRTLGQFEFHGLALI